jgi:hypothetical protein
MGFNSAFKGLNFFISLTAYLSLHTVIQLANLFIGLILVTDLQSEFLNDILVTALFERVIWLQEP